MASKFLCRLAARPHPLNAAGQSITLQQDLSRPLAVLDLSAAPNRQKAQPAEFKLYNFTEFMGLQHQRGLTGPWLRVAPGSISYPIL